VKRRQFIAGLGSAVAWPIAARAQQPAMPVIGFFSSQSADDEYKYVTVPFLQGLKETGYVVGQNVAVEYQCRHVDACANRGSGAVRSRTFVGIVPIDVEIGEAALLALSR
jgi:hypothetical protein